MDFTDKVVLITGGGSGIGADAGFYLAKLGAKIVFVDRNEERLNEIVEKVKNAGFQTPFGILADVAKDAERIIDKSIKHFKKLDVLINSAGVVKPDNVADFKIDEFDRMMAVNLRSVFLLSHFAVPHLEKTKGNIVNVSSIAGIKPSATFVSYAVSKAALDHFTKCSAIGLAPKGIRVNSVNPAAIRTPLAETLGLTKEQAEKYFDDFGKTYPMGRCGVVKDTSAAIAYLASDEASFVNGVLLAVDGGSSIGSVQSM